MKKNPLMEELRKSVSNDIKREIDLSFDIVNRIHYILESKNLTQKDLAKALGKSEAEISKWMRGTHNFTCKTLAKIETALGERIIEVVGKPDKKGYVFISMPSNITLPRKESVEILSKVDFTRNFNDISKVGKTYSHN